MPVRAMTTSPGRGPSPRRRTARPRRRGDGRTEAGEGVIAGGRTEDRASGRDARGDLGEDRALEPDRWQRRRRHINPASGPPPNRGSGSPLTPGSSAKRPPASGWLGSTWWDPPPPIVVMNRVDEPRAAERRHRRFRDGRADPPSIAPAGVTRRTIPPRTHATVAAGLVDGRPVRPARQWPEVQEDPLVGGLAGIDVVVVRPDRLPRGIGEVHRSAVRGEREPVATPIPERTVTPTRPARSDGASPWPGRPPPDRTSTRPRIDQPDRSARR